MINSEYEGRNRNTYYKITLTQVTVGVVARPESAKEELTALLMEIREEVTEWLKAKGKDRCAG